jgi:hypothetical protein
MGTKLNTQTWAYAKFQSNTMTVRKQIQDDARKGVFMHVFLKMIYSYLWQLFEWKDAVRSRRSQAHLRWAYNENGLKLLAPIAPNKSVWASCKNPNAMIRARNP